MDNFFRHWFKREAATETPTATTTQTAENAGTYEEKVETVSSQDKALRIATYYRCLNLRANTMAQLTVQYQRLNKDGGNFVQDNYGKADNAGQMFDTIVHEMKHLAEHVGEYYGVDSREELSAYLQGEVGRNMWPAAAMVLCPKCH